MLEVGKLTMEVPQCLVGAHVLLHEWYLAVFPQVEWASQLPWVPKRSLILTPRVGSSTYNSVEYSDIQVIAKGITLKDCAVSVLYDPKALPAIL